MNKKVAFIQELLTEGIAIPCKNSDNRIRQEKTSAIQLRGRTDLLSLYNYAIRLIFLLMLRHGYDIRQEKVHQAMQFGLVNLAGFSTGEAVEVIRWRHRYKYKKLIAPACIPERLNEFINTIQPENSLK